MREKQVVVHLPQGLHARPATLFVKTATAFSSEIGLVKGDKSANAKSIIGVMSLAVANGETVKLTADGSDEEEALDKLAAFLEQGAE
ncbi:HPr family phosphocarrier protein [Brevibacillus borstelensis]|jgi:catabolite repression HPr-like protein|uniref:Phosphocarrier protein HPr n=1 Tax=Brevibacillus borstelensis AK1 TaxID=1300222 RepID=M8EBK3_9BACL|nr:HPr family phosphocarrier protein [Brevibacillus borstelensis]EMT52875.1 phosphocarrier protein HPr [Brevibacillus borstelensis AK1]MED1884659.1 HPr family phosphocarrier protein [Brevibacillus borstelensis]RNB63612.1 HPr family phosphocarrier protein [Brevibacillus borstelensis]GED50908.1 PTS sugar transporter subunit IIA [Brevibacillus borstelensis]